MKRISKNRRQLFDVHVRVTAKREKERDRGWVGGGGGTRLDDAMIPLLSSKVLDPDACIFNAENFGNRQM